MQKTRTKKAAATLASQGLHISLWRFIVLTRNGMKYGMSHVSDLKSQKTSLLLLPR